MSSGELVRGSPDARGLGRRRLRGLLLLIAKFALAFGVIYWLYRQGFLDLSALGALEPDARTAVLLGGASIAVCAAMVVIAYRLYFLLRVQRFAAQPKDLVKLTWAAALCGVVAPGLLGADALKVAYLCSRVSERRLDVFAAIVFDRIVGLLSLLLLGTVALAVAWAADAVPPAGPVLWAAPAALAVVAAGCFLVTWDRTYRLAPVQWLLHHMPAAVQTLVQAFRLFSSAPREIAIATALSLVGHALIVVVFVLAARLIHDPLSVFDHAVLSPIAVTMNAVPVTPGGLGVTEGAFAYLAKTSGSDNGALIALISRLVQYGVFLVGGLVAIFSLRWQGYRIPSAV